MKSSRMLANKRILVIEDNEFQRKTLVMSLTAMGVGHVAEAANGRQALALLEADANEFDFTICDLRMEVMDGVEFLRYAPSLRMGALILASVLDDVLLSSAEEIAKSHGAWFAGRLIKPIDFSYLKLLISSGHAVQAAQPDSVDSRPVRIWGREDLCIALQQMQLVPYFQPKVQFCTRVPVGVEVLARWIHPEYGELPPSQFVPLMEREGLIDQLAEDLLHQALVAMKKWYSTGHEVGIALNASSLTLQDVTITERWLAIANEHGVAPEMITVELTETALSTNYVGLLETATRLRMHGFGLSLDDFGTGYASLQQLRQMPFTEIKIDRSFIVGALEKERSVAILDAIVDLARKLRLQTVAEGIESEGDAEFMQALGCYAGQGYYFAKAMSSDDLVSWLLHEKLSVRNAH